jgi:hypothetical protein
MLIELGTRYCVNRLIHPPHNKQFESIGMETEMAHVDAQNKHLARSKKLFAFHNAQVGLGFIISRPREG